ncbi:MAG: hypothetical protein ACMG6S_05905, partial [Byssovorax sp.]
MDVQRRAAIARRLGKDSRAASAAESSPVAGRPICRDGLGGAPGPVVRRFCDLLLFAPFQGKDSGAPQIGANGPKRSLFYSNHAQLYTNLTSQLQVPLQSQSTLNPSWMLLHTIPP